MSKIVTIFGHRTLKKMIKLKLNMKNWLEYNISRWNLSTSIEEEWGGRSYEVAERAQPHVKQGFRQFSVAASHVTWL